MYWYVAQVAGGIHRNAGRKANGHCNMQMHHMPVLAPSNACLSKGDALRGLRRNLSSGWAESQRLSERRPLQWWRWGRAAP